MGLAFLVWAISFAMAGRYAACGILSGLALSSNLTMAFPVAGLALAIVVLEEGAWPRRFRSVTGMVAPAAVIFFGICWRALRSAHRINFYYGCESVKESLFDLARHSFGSADRADVLGTDAAMAVFVMGILPLIAIFVVTASLLGAGKRRQLFPFMTLTGAMGAIVGGHFAIGLEYPADRTGLALLLLFGVAWAIAAARVESSAWRAVQVGLGLVAAFQFTVEWRTDFFSTWKFDMATKEISQRIQRASAGRPPNSMSIWETWWHAPSLEFYRRHLNMTAIQPVRHTDSIEYSGHDFFVVSDGDVRGLDARKIRVIFSNQRAGVVLGVPAQR